MLQIKMKIINNIKPMLTPIKHCKEKE